VPNFLYFFFNTCLLLVLMGKVKKIGKFAVGNYWIPVSAIIGCLIGWGLSADGPTPAYLADGSTPALPTLRDTYGEDAFSPQLIFPLHAPNSVFRADCVADGESSGGHRRLSVYDDCVPGTDIVQFIVAAAKIAFVCALETILSAKVASVRRKDYPFDEPRELAAVSISHFVQFITGTLPNTGLFLRTTANAVGGATHRWSQLMHVLLLGILTGALSRFFGYLPKAGAAAILVTGSFRMVPYNYLARLWRNDKMRLALTVLVTAVSCFEDPVVGLLLGIGLSLVSEATRMVQGGNAVVITQLAKQQRTGFKVTINGSLNYIVGEQVEKAMKVLKGTAEFVVVDMASVFEADSDGAMYLEKGKTGLEAAEPSCPIFLMNMLPQVAEVLRGTSSDLRELEKKVPAKGLQIDMSPWEEKAGSAWGQSVPIVDGPRHRSAGGDAADNRESLSL
jgi:MFS superfamily sulfate permease-like transporter